MKNTSKKHSTDRGKQYPIVGNFISYHIAQQGLTKAAVARSLGILPNGLAAYCKNDTLQFAVLWKLSLVLKHNFLAQLGEYLPTRFETIREKALKEQLAENEKQIAALQLQLEMFKKIHKIE